MKEEFILKKLLIICALIILFAGLNAKNAFADQNYSKNVAAGIRNFLIIDEWKFSFDEDKGIFRFGLNIDGKLKNIDYLVRIHKNAYTVYAISPLRADSESKLSIAAMAEFICRANYGLRNGNFELDCNDGEIRYKIYVNCSEVMPSREIVRTSILIPAMMFERYSPGILDLIFTDAQPIDAIKKCEGD